MAAFSYQHDSFHLDSFLAQNAITTPMKLSGFAGGMGHENNINDSSFLPSQFYPSDQFSSEYARFNESMSCVEHTSSIKVSDNNEYSVSRKQSMDMDSSIVVDKLESGEQVTQKVNPLNKKRKSRNGSTLTSAQSKGSREGNSKKQVKCKGEEVKKKGAKSKKKVVIEEDGPKDYVHVRARRGQATDSHSLAERVRREKISERMKVLQNLVPGCDKVTGKALMLDEIINYVQSLQNQVEFLSMKLTSVNPIFYDFGVDMESFMLRPERMVGLASARLEECMPTPRQSTAFSDATTTTSFVSAPNNYPFLDNFIQQNHNPTFISPPPPPQPQDNASIMWELEDQRQKFHYPSGFNTNLCSFH